MARSGSRMRWLAVLLFTAHCLLPTAHCSRPLRHSQATASSESSSTTTSPAAIRSRSPTSTATRSRTSSPWGGHLRLVREPDLEEADRHAGQADARDHQQRHGRPRRRRQGRDRHRLRVRDERADQGEARAGGAGERPRRSLEARPDRRRRQHPPPALGRRRRRHEARPDRGADLRAQGTAAGVRRQGQDPGLPARGVPKAWTWSQQAVARASASSTRSRSGRLPRPRAGPSS